MRIDASLPDLSPDLSKDHPFGDRGMMDNGTDQLMSSVSTELGVTMELFDMPDGIVLADMQRDDGEPGSGKLALQRLVDYADFVSKRICLSVLDDEPKLVRFYASVGFIVIDPTDDDVGGIRMERVPNASG